MKGAVGLLENQSSNEASITSMKTPPLQLCNPEKAITLLPEFLANI